jgi:hypothetical protein
VARDRQGRERSRRAAAHQQPSGGRRPADDLLEPIEHFALDVDGAVVAAGDARIDGGGHRRGHNANRRRRRVHPAEEAWMTVAEGVRQQPLLEFLEQRGERHAAMRSLALRPCRERGRHRSKHGTTRQRRQVLGDAGEHLRAGIANLGCRPLEW